MGVDKTRFLDRFVALVNLRLLMGRLTRLPEEHADECRRPDSDQLARRQPVRVKLQLVVELYLLT